MTADSRVEVERHEIGGDAWSSALRSARVLVIGAGALGSVAAGYLAACGTGMLGLVDGGEVTPEDLVTQPASPRSDLGRSKAEALAGRLGANDPEAHAEAYPAFLDTDNAEAIVAGHDVVIDCTNDPDTSVAAADACAALGILFVTGAVSPPRGAAATIQPGAGPCARCTHEALALFFADSTGPAPALEGPLAGVIGSLEAIEALKVLAGACESLAGRALTVDAFTQAFGELSIPSRADCTRCGAG